MFKKIIIFLFTYFCFINLTLNAADNKGSQTITGLPQIKVKKYSSYKLAEKKINKAIKLENKGKIKKSIKLYKEAIKYLLEENKKRPANPNTLNYLGFTNKKIKNSEYAEIYYLLGLDIDPNHIDLNKNLGEFYVETNRADKAKKLLKILKACNCEEYVSLKNTIKISNSK